MRNNALSEREREMARKTSIKRGAAIVTVIAALAALTGPGVASAARKPTPPAAPSVPAPPAAKPPVGLGFGVIASWAEEASWAES
jgi:hypothetical protein